MTINIVCTSKPCDGLLFYSYEYCSYLNSIGVDSKVVIVGHRKFKNEDYLNTIASKYIHCKNIEFENFSPKENDVTLIMGRSMMTLPYQDFKSYSPIQKSTLKALFAHKVIAVYSENHPVNYGKAVEFFNPSTLVDLCDRQVYPNGEGEHFEKRIFFDIYKEPENDPQFEFLFLGTNKNYYQTAQKYLPRYSDHGILTYKNDDYVDPKNNNVFVPIDNVLGVFNTFVYTKSTFDPAPRIVQECKYFDKNQIYSRDPSIKDGGSVYWERPIKQLDASPILNAADSFLKKRWFDAFFASARGKL